MSHLILFLKYLLFQLNVDKPPKKVGGGKLTGALAAMKAEEAKMKEAEEQKKQIEDKMKAMKAEQEAKKSAAAEASAAADEEEEKEEGSERGMCEMVILNIFFIGQIVEPRKKSSENDMK